MSIPVTSVNLIFSFVYVFSPHKKSLTVSLSLINYMLERLMQGGFLFGLF